MSGIMIKNVSKPDETRLFQGKGHLDVLKLGETTVGYATFQPGWKWAENVKPIAGTDSCEAAHIGYCLSGRMRLKMDDGEEREIRPGDSFTIEPGHDAWVVGNENCVLLDFSGFTHYAERGATMSRGKMEKAEHPSMH